MNIKMKKSRFQLTPPQILALGFALVILAGTLLLALPVATTDGNGTRLIDALFTSTSAVCVTGLGVVDTGTFFTPFGQFVIALMMQVGGLGFMTMSVLFALAVGKKIMLKERLIMQEALNQVNLQGIVRVTKFLVAFAFAVEFIAALILAYRWMPEMGAAKAFWYGLFHAVSAYCNGGFGLFADSLSGYVADPTVNLVITTLIILGGIGLTVLVDVSNCIAQRKIRLSLHSKMVLSITAGLILFGTIVIFLFERGNSGSMAQLSLGGKVLGAYFQSVTARTAGFNTLPIGDLNRITLFIVIILMFIGASPGSTGGGIKTTTFGVIMALIRSILRGKLEVEIYHRTIPQEVILKALTLFVMSLGIVLVGTTALLYTEPFLFIQVLFEEVSAFATVGLSMGITPQLSISGKLIVIATMFLGRLGPLTLAFALTEQMRKKSHIKYPEERVTVG